MNNSSATTSSPTSGRKPKRIRRKCAHEGCDNRVVQGGVCVTHGAKRKLCSFPDCDKAVKLAGYCSTHGPSRRKCGTAGCTRVAVQGGQCLSHGARRRLCCYPGVTEGDKGGGGAKQCQKNAIMGGMCKKHHDRMQDAEGMLVMSLCVPVSNGSGNNSSSEEGDDVFSQQPQQQPRGGIVSASGSLKSEEGGVERGEEVDSTASSILSSTINEAQIQPSSLSMPVPPLQPIDNNGNHELARPHKKMKPSHTRGLSIFDDLSTVDAIISSGAENRAHEVVVPAFPPPLQHQVRSAPPLPMPLQQQQQQQQGFPPPKLMNKITPESVSGIGMNSSCVMPPLGVLSSIKTPTAQVSFADMPPNKTNRSSNNRPSSSGSDDEPCTGNSSCVCKACRSPTLAIFEQMIEASHKIERAEVGVIDPSSEKYAGLSPPKLSRGNSNASSSSPRKYSGKMVRQGSDTMTPKNVSFVPVEEPTSSGSVVRKVSSQNIVGEAQTVEDSTAGGCAVGEQAGGPTSQALPLPQQEVDDSGVSRTVSHDAPPSPESSGAHLIHLQPTQPHPQHHLHPDATFQNQQLLRYHYVSYHGPSHHDTYHNMHHPAPSYYQGQGHALPQYHYQAPLSHAPLTPQLYDHQGHAADSQSVQYPNSAPAAAMVSSHSTYLQEQQQLHLLPRRRESIEHLFIPKEV